MKILIFAVSLFASLIAAQDCSLCPDGSQSYTADKPVIAKYFNVYWDVEIDPNVMTCDDLAGLALVDNSSNTCELLQAHAAWCECAGVTPICTLCPNGDTPVDGSIVVPFSNLTCDDYDYLISVVVPSATVCAYNQDFTSFCGCPGVTLNDTCSLCPNGETPPNPDAVDSVFGTCADIETLATSIPPGNFCTLWQVAGFITCGCSPSNQTSTGNCTVCADGSSFPNPDKAVVVTDSSPPITITCGTFGSFVSLLDGDECAVVSNVVANACDCTPAVSSPTTCPLCEDGGIAPRFFDFVIPDSTCYEIAAFFASEDAGSLNCTAMQATLGAYCGCNNTKASQAATCRVCGGDMLLPDPAAIALEFVSCGQLEYEANAGEILCSEARSYASVCCDSTVTDTPASTSSPAPAGSSPTVSPASGPPGVQPTSQPTPSTSGAMVSAVMVSAFLTMNAIGFGLL